MNVADWMNGKRGGGVKMTDDDVMLLIGDDVYEDDESKIAALARGLRTAEHLAVWGNEYPPTGITRDIVRYVLEAKGIVDGYKERDGDNGGDEMAGKL